MTTLDNTPLFTLGEVAERTRLHPETIRRMVTDGRLPAVKVAGRWRIRLDDVDALLEPASADPR
jgi:excisionase family DNA binding protein